MSKLDKNDYQRGMKISQEQMGTINWKKMTFMENGTTQ